MKIYLDNNLGVTNVEQEELTQDTIGYNILKVYIPNAVLTPYDTFTCYYGALLQNGRKVGWFAMEARTSSDADYEANYTLYKATLEQCVVSVEGKVYIGCQVLLGNSGNATLIKKNTAVVQFNVRKSVAINNDILVLDTDQTTTDVLESYKNLLENALTTYATKATTYTKTEVNSALALKADKSDTYTKTEVDTINLNLAGQIAGARVELNNRINTTNGILTATQAEVAKLKSVQNVVEVVATYSALQSYDTTKLDVNDKVQVIADESHDGASTIYNWSGSAWQYVGAYGTNSAPKATAITHTGNQLQDYSGNNVYPNLDDKCVAIENTFFIKGLQNIFNKDIVTSGYYDQSNGNYRTSSSYSNSGYLVIDGIKVLTDNGLNSGQRHFCFYDKNKTYISGGYQTNTLTVPSNAYYLIVSIQNGLLDTYMLSIGNSVPNDYVAYSGIIFTDNINIPATSIKGKITANQADFIIEASKNLFNKNTVTYDKYCKQNNGTVADLVGWVMSEYIEIDATKLTIIDNVSTSGARHYVFFDNTKTYISGGYGTGTFNIPSNAKYIVTSFNTSVTSINSYQLEYGSTVTTYEEYYPKHLKEDIKVIAEKDSNFRVLTVGANKEYTTIGGAYTDANEGDIILVYEGTYNEELHFTKLVYLIGVNREKCILQYSGAEYNHEPISFVKGSIQNLTIITLQDTMVGTSPAYCLHIDSRNGCKNQAIYIENCRFIQNMTTDKGSTVGLALANNFTLEFENCEFINNGEGVAFYCHSCEIFNDTSYTDLTGQKLVVKNCSMLNNSSTKPTILIQSEEISGAYAECLWQRNIVINQNVNGQTIDVQYYTNGAGSPDLPKNNWLNTTDWHNSALSLMNNITELNEN